MIRALPWEHGRCQLSLLSISVFALCCTQVGGGGCTDVLVRSAVGRVHRAGLPALGVGKQHSSILTLRALQFGCAV